MVTIVDHGKKRSERINNLNQAVAIFSENFAKNKAKAKAKTEVETKNEIKNKKKKVRNTSSKAPRTDTLKGNMFDDLMNNLF
jgi:hypothetical protein